MEEQDQLPEDKSQLIARLIRSFNMLKVIFWFVLGLLVLIWADPDFIHDEYWEARNVEIQIGVEGDLDMRDSVFNGIHVMSGLVAEGDYKLVFEFCGSCHNHALVTQNRATKDGWKEIIVWMQEKQEMQDLGEYEEPILTYLSTYYAPKEGGRRPPLNQDEIDWYELKPNQ